MDSNYPATEPVPQPYIPPEEPLEAPPKRKGITLLLVVIIVFLLLCCCCGWLLLFYFYLGDQFTDALGITYMLGTLLSI